jgi:two-component system NarL family sensor kinase
MRWLAVLRILLLPIVFAGDRLVGHPDVSDDSFTLIFVVACVYAAIALAVSRRRRANRAAWLFASLDLLLVCALTYESGGAFSQLHWAFLFLPLGAAILLDPRRTAAVSLITTVAYLIVALTHPSTHPKQLHLVLAQCLYIAWVGVMAVVLSGLLARRQSRIVKLASERGSLVAQALAAEDRARQRLADGLHDSTIQNLLAARQELAEARAGAPDGIDQLRATVGELHPYVLEQLGLESALRTVAQQQARRGGYKLDLRIDPDAVGVCDRLIFSVGRELLANVTRHASATRVDVELSGDAREIALKVTDDGRGFAHRQLGSSLRRGHIGLASCRERVHAVGGRFEITSRRGGGTTVLCVVPGQLQAASDERAAADVTPPHLALSG